MTKKMIRMYRIDICRKLLILFIKMKLNILLITLALFKKTSKAGPNPIRTQTTSNLDLFSEIVNKKKKE